MIPIELLQKELNVLLRNKEKSVLANAVNKIDLKLHWKHISNLNPQTELNK